MSFMRVSVFAESQSIVELANMGRRHVPSQLLIVAFPSPLVLQILFGLEWAAIAPFAPVIAGGVTGGAALLAARFTRGGTLKATNLSEKHKAITEIKRALYDVKVSFDSWIDPAADPVKAQSDGEKVQQRMGELKRAEAAHRHLFAQKTRVSLRWTVDQFDRHERGVAGVMLIGKARSPNFQTVLESAREWLRYYDAVTQEQLDEHFSQETATTRSILLRPVTGNPVSKRVSEWRRAGLQRHLDNRQQRYSKALVQQRQVADTRLAREGHKRA
jgi:hypothetical protein